MEKYKKYNRSDLEVFLQEIRTFFGEDWFDERRKKEGGLDVISDAHPVIRWWIKVREFLDGVKRHDLNVTPIQEALQIMRLGSCLRAIKGADVVDINGNILNKSVIDLFISRFRSSAAFYSAFYETLVASAYIRNGHSISFIDDNKRRSPEFFVDVDGVKVYVECKRIERRRRDKATEDWMKIVANRVKHILLYNKKRVAVFIVCPEQTYTVEPSLIIRQVEKLLRTGKVPDKSEYEGLKFIVEHLPPCRVVWARKGNQQEMMETWFRDFLNPWKRGVLGHTDTAFEVPLFRAKLMGREHTLCITDAYVGVAFMKSSNIIGGVEKIIRKASRQLLSDGIGLVYIECPTYNASPNEINEFGRTVNHRVKRTKHINSAILTGTLLNLDSIQHISNVFYNDKSVRTLPNGFRIIPLDEIYEFELSN